MKPRPIRKTDPTDPKRSPCTCGSGKQQIRCCGVLAENPHSLDDDCPLCRHLATIGGTTVEIEVGEPGEEFTMLFTDPTRPPPSAS